MTNDNMRDNTTNPILFIFIITRKKRFFIKHFIWRSGRFHWTISDFVKKMNETNVDSVISSEPILYRYIKLYLFASIETICAKYKLLIITITDI